MKANEIRYGNYVTDLSNDGKTRIECQVGIDQLEYTHDCEPIRITTEWLEKFGFDRVSRQSFSTGKLVEYGTWEFNGMLYNEIQDKFYYRGFPVDVKFIHQLQNLYFALTGEELTIQE